MHCSILNRLISSSHTLLTHLQFAQQNAFLTIVKPFSSAALHDAPISKEQQQQQQQQQQQSFVVSYLIDSCGVTPERAKSLSCNCRLKFENPDRPDSVLAFLREHGFTNKHIAKLVSGKPELLSCKSPEKTLLPKFEFLYSVGVSRDCLPDIVYNCNNLISRSLEGAIIPAYNFLRSVMSSDEEVVTILKRRPWFSFTKETNNATTNIEFLKRIGVPQSKIVYLMEYAAESVLLDHDEFCQRVNEVVDMGFDVSKTSFVWALRANFRPSNRAKLEHSFKVYGKWGWSSDENLSAFKTYPQCMFLSEKNITRTMDFLVNKIGVESGVFARWPQILCFSFEKRILPRFSVVWFLEQKGLLVERPSLSCIMNPSEKKFLHKFVTKFIQDAPQLLCIYQRKVDPFTVCSSAGGGTSLH